MNRSIRVRCIGSVGMALAMAITVTACGGDGGGADGSDTSEQSASSQPDATTLPTTTTFPVPAENIFEVPMNCSDVVYLDPDTTTARFSNISFPGEYQISSIPAGTFISPVIHYKESWFLDISALGTGPHQVLITAMLGEDTSTRDCELSTDRDPVPEGTTIVTLENGKLTPSNLEIDLSHIQVVRWINDDPPRDYVITSREDGLFESPLLAPGDSWEFDFSDLPPGLHRYNTMIGDQRIPGYVDTSATGTEVPTADTGGDLIDLTALPDVPAPVENALVFDRTIEIDAAYCDRQSGDSPFLYALGHDEQGLRYWLGGTTTGFEVNGIDDHTISFHSTINDGSFSPDGSVAFDSTLDERLDPDASVQPAVLRASCAPDPEGSVLIATPDGRATPHPRALCYRADDGFTFAARLDAGSRWHVAAAGGRLSDDALQGFATDLHLLDEDEPVVPSEEFDLLVTASLSVPLEATLADIINFSAVAVAPATNGSGLITSGEPGSQFVMEAQLIPFPGVEDRLKANPRLTVEAVMEYMDLLLAEFDGPARVEVECATVIEGPPGSTALDLLGWYW